MRAVEKTHNSHPDEPFLRSFIHDAYQASLVILQKITFGDFTPITMKDAKWDTSIKTIKPGHALFCSLIFREPLPHFLLPQPPGLPAFPPQAGLFPCSFHPRIRQAPS